MTERPAETSPDESPSRFRATPTEIDAFLRQHFAEDQLQRFYRAVGDLVLDEVLCTGQAWRAEKEREQSKYLYLAGAQDVLHAVLESRYPANLPNFSPVIKEKKTHE